MKNGFTKLHLVLCGFLAGSLQLASASTLECGKYVGCERKFCEIEQQITIASSKENQAKVEGLKIALNQSKSTCTNESLVEDLTSEISEVEEELREYESDLLEAQNDNKSDKVKKYTDKIAEEKQKLSQLTEELNTLK
ncbi:DUF1090 domain-containing protein [Vibrio gallaecicus]|uniref:DUF1090 domain-containing protein n=1 Tax=Vibrio gallaecicus TaxID=552386 RepID=A0ABV4N8M6_9VIBR